MFSIVYCPKNDDMSPPDGNFPYTFYPVIYVAFRAQIAIIFTFKDGRNSPLLGLV